MIKQSNITYQQMQEKMMKYQNRIEDRAKLQLYQHNQVQQQKLKGLFKDPYRDNTISIADQGHNSALQAQIEQKKIAKMAEKLEDVEIRHRIEQRDKFASEYEKNQLRKQQMKKIEYQNMLKEQMKEQNMLKRQQFKMSDKERQFNKNKYKSLLGANNNEIIKQVIIIIHGSREHRIRLIWLILK